MTKSTIIRNTSIVAASAAMLAASVAPANAFAVAQAAAPVQSTPALATYDTGALAPTTTWNYEAPATVETASVESTPALAPQVNAAPEVSKNVDLSHAREAVLAAAYDGLGGAYVWGGHSYKAWDCSGFVSYVYAQAGINLTAYTYTMATQLTPTANPQPGDIVFTNGYSHVGIYVGDGKMISALNPSQGTMLTDVDGGGFMPVDGYYTAGI